MTYLAALRIPPETVCATTPRAPLLPSRRGGGRWPWWAGAISLALHVAALALLLGFLRDGLAPPDREQGVEIVWQDVPQDSLATGTEPGGGPEVPPAVETPAVPELPPGPPVPPTPAPPAVEAVAPPPPPPPQQQVATPAPAQPAAQPPPPPPPSPVAAEAELPPVPEAPPAAAPALAEIPPPPPEAKPEQDVAEAAPQPAAEEVLPLPPDPMPPPPPTRTAETRQAQPRPAAALPPSAPPMRLTPGFAPLTTPGEGERQAALAGASRATGAVVPPGLLDGYRNPQPDYPAQSRARGEQGVVGLVLHVSPAGQVTQVDIGRGSGFAALDEAARRAALRWRFRPASRDGVAVEGTIRTQVHFRLVQ